MTINEHVNTAYLQKIVRAYNDAHDTNYVLATVNRNDGIDCTFRIEHVKDDTKGIRIYCNDFGDDGGLHFFTSSDDAHIFSKELTPVDYIESAADMEYDGEPFVRKNIEVNLVENGDNKLVWQITDTQGGKVIVQLRDLEILQKYIDYVYMKNNPLLMWSFYTFINEHMCKKCTQDCKTCAVDELRKMVARRIPDYNDVV